MNGRRPTICVNVPTRWATNFFVLDSILNSCTALQLAVSSEEWGHLSAGSQSGDVRKHLMDAKFWKEVAMLVELLRPFSDAIHQLEGDKPHLSECHEALILLRKHVEAWVTKHQEQGEANAMCPLSRAVPTMDRRLNAQPGGMVAPVYNAAYSAAYAVDPFYAEVEETPSGPFCCAPIMDEEHMEAAQELVKRIGGPKSVSQFSQLFSQGYPQLMQPVVAGLAAKRKPGPVGSKRAREEVPSSLDRLRVWRRFGGKMPELQSVAVRLLSAHATSAATERNWSLWGRMYCSARSSLGMDRAKALIAICAAERAKQDPTKEFEITLSVLEGNTDV